MKKLIIGLQWLSVIFTVLSFLVIILSLWSFEFNTSIDIIQSVNNIYKAIVIYSWLYNFTFIICAFWVTLRQLEISQNNYNTTSQQVKFIQADILDKRRKDEKNETLKQCSYFLSEFQLLLRKITEQYLIGGTPIYWSSLAVLTNASVKKSYPNFHKRMDEVDRVSKNEIIITLHKLEAFSTLFIYGNLDKELAQQIIGYTYVAQVEFLLGFISYFRENTETVFGQNIIKLFNEWKK